MIDLHCHILPFVDDGAENASVACAMAEHALRCGVDTVVATPHCNLHGARGNYRGDEYSRSLAMFRALLRQHHIPLRVLPGAENFCHRNGFAGLLREKRFLTLNGSRYFLAEFNFFLERRDHHGASADDCRARLCAADCPSGAL